MIVVAAVVVVAVVDVQDVQDVASSCGGVLLIAVSSPRFLRRVFQS